MDINNYFNDSYFNTSSQIENFSAIPPLAQATETVASTEAVAAKAMRKQKNGWSPEVRERMAQLSDQYGKFTEKWEKIRDTIIHEFPETAHRGGVDVFKKALERYQTAPDKPVKSRTQRIKPGDWTPEESRKLIDTIGIEKGIGEAYWKKTAKSIGLGRTGEQCRQHWGSLNRNQQKKLKKILSETLPSTTAPQASTIIAPQASTTIAPQASTAPVPVERSRKRKPQKEEQEKIKRVRSSTLPSTTIPEKDGWSDEAKKEVFRLVEERKKDKKKIGTEGLKKIKQLLVEKFPSLANKSTAAIRGVYDRQVVKNSGLEKSSKRKPQKARAVQKWEYEKSKNLIRYLNTITKEKGESRADYFARIGSLPGLKETGVRCEMHEGNLKRNKTKLARIQAEIAQETTTVIA